MADLSFTDFIAEQEKKKKLNMETVGKEYEQQLAKTLYDRPDVKRAGQEALTKVSTLLVRYNRLKDAEKKQKMEIAERSQEAQMRRTRRMDVLNKQKIKVAELQDDEQKKKELEKIAELEKTIQDDYDEDLRKATKQTERAFREGLSESIDDDTAGGILSTLMLGGNAVGSTGYTLTTGNAADLFKGKEYIQDMTGEEGTLLSQMALLDNAVNTSGVDIEKNDKDAKINKIDCNSNYLKIGFLSLLLLLVLF